MKEKIEKKLKNGPRGLALMIFLFVLTFIVGSGAGLGTGYYLGKNKGREMAEAQKEEEQQQAKEEVEGGEESESTENGETAELTYTVQEGDTLFAIGLKFNIPWIKIAEANGLTEDSVIEVGQVLKIPGVAGSGESKSFEIDQKKAEGIQSQVDAGQLLWYLDPVSVAKDQIPSTYSISENDRFELKSKNTAEGIAIVEVIHNTKVYQVKLIQPVKKGSDGIWAVESVSRI